MDTIKTTRETMQKSISALATALAKIRTGRAHAGMLDGISVNCYDSSMPLAQVATVTVSDSTSLMVAVWDKQNTAAVEKAIRTSDLQVNPAVTGSNIRVPLPPLSEERRKDLVKLVNKEAEEAKISLRNARRDGLDTIKAAVKNKEMGEDDGKRLEQEVQKVLTEMTQKIDTMVGDKQKELMTL